MRYLLPPVSPLCVALLLAACSATDDQSAPGGVSQGEAAALNDAAVMLDGDAMTINNTASEPEDQS